MSFSLPAFVPLPLLLTASLIVLSYPLSYLFYNLYLHPLAKYPGPLPARATDWYKTYIEVYRQQSMVHLLIELHGRYGDVVRIAPNEVCLLSICLSLLLPLPRLLPFSSPHNLTSTTPQLHFSSPSAFNHIYSPRHRWNKDLQLYRSFGEDTSSFGFLTYSESKARKDVMQPLFSRRAIISMQHLVWSHIGILVSRITAENARGRPVDLLFALRAFTMDMVTSFCFARTVDAMSAPGFAAPIVQAMDASSPTFVLLKHFPLFRKFLFSLPPWLAIKLSPETAGLTHLQVMLKAQVDEVVADPGSLERVDHEIVYHRLLDREVAGEGGVPGKKSLYEEAQALMFAGGDSVANTLMVGLFHVLDHPKTLRRLKEEIARVWPVLDEHPSFETLEALPVLTATIKESLRIAPGVPSPLLRVVPDGGAVIDGRTIPGGTVVGMSTVMVHTSNEIFKNADVFDIDRWMGPDAAGLDQWLVTFSKGPRSCLGINLAYCEMYIAMATLIRSFELKLNGTTAAELVWRDTFLPFFTGKHLHAWCEPVKAVSG
jgi:cytochrome P450